MIDRRLILLGSGDNCLAVVVSLIAGDTVEIEGHHVTLPVAIGIGHKLARRDIAAGEKVIKYGAVIGSAKVAIRCGEHVHLHNLASDYLPTYTLPPA